MATVSTGSALVFESYSKEERKQAYPSAYEAKEGGGESERKQGQQQAARSFFSSASSLPPSTGILSAAKQSALVRALAARTRADLAACARALEREREIQRAIWTHLNPPSSSPAAVELDREEEEARQKVYEQNRRDIIQRVERDNLLASEAGMERLAQAKAKQYQAEAQARNKRKQPREQSEEQKRAEREQMEQRARELQAAMQRRVDDEKRQHQQEQHRRGSTSQAAEHALGKQQEQQQAKQELQQEQKDAEKKEREEVPRAEEEGSSGGRLFPALQSFR